MKTTLQVLADKLTQLAYLTSEPRRFSLPDPVTPAGFVRALSSFSEGVIPAGVEDARNVASVNAGLVRDLFGFLRRLPTHLDSSLCRIGRIPPEPIRAYQEPAAGTFWAFAALIQDVWEHCFGPEAEAAPRILHFLTRTARHHVLDFGSGAGYFACYLAAQAASVDAIEPNPVKRDFLRFRRQAAGMSNISLAWRQHRYDMVLAINVLDHVKDPVRSIQKIASKMQPGGLLVCCAAFPLDDWHSNTTGTKAVYEALMRYFDYSDGFPGAAPDILALVRRDRPERSRADLSDPKCRVRLHPAAILAPVPGSQEDYALCVPYFYARSVMLSRQGLELAKLCRNERPLRQVRAGMRKNGFTSADVNAAIRLLSDCNLLLLR